MTQGTGPGGQDPVPASSSFPFMAGLFCRCPACGKAPLFQDYLRGYLRVIDRCGNCGENLSAHEQGDGPAVFVIMILGFVVVGMALFVELRYAPPLWVHWVAWPPVILAGALALLRPLKGIMVAAHFHHRRQERERD